MNWWLSNRADKRVLPLADRHYNRQKPGTPQFIPPGRCLVLRTIDNQAVWCTSWPFAQYVKHEWPGAWVNSLFRREAGPQASTLIREAVAVTRWYWPTIPSLGMITFVDDKKVRHKRDPGRCYIKAGFKYVGLSEGGKLCFQLLPKDMPAPERCNAEQATFFEYCRSKEHEIGRHADCQTCHGREFIRSFP